MPKALFLVFFDMLEASFRLLRRQKKEGVATPRLDTPS